MPALLNRIISYMSAVPDYLIMLWNDYPAILIVAGALFVIALFFPELLQLSSAGSSLWRASCLQSRADLWDRDRTVIR